MNIREFNDGDAMDLKRTASVALVLLATYLVVSAAPVAAAHVAVVSSNRTADELSSGSLSNVDVQGSGTDGYVEHSGSGYLDTAKSHWKLDEGSGSTAADSVGGFDGTLQNAPTWTSGVNGTALAFDLSQNQYVEAPAYSGSTDQFTAVAQIKPQDETGGAIISTGKDGGGSETYGFLFDHGQSSWENDRVSLYFGNGADGTYAISPKLGLDYPTTEYHQVAVVFDSGTIQWYLDGEHIDTDEESISTVEFDGSRPTFLGREYSDYGGHQYFNGSIDEPRVFMSALDDTQIAELNRNPQRELGNVGHYEATHDASNTVEGWTNLELANATAMVTWEGYDGNSWTTLDEATYSSSGNYSVSWSEFSGDEVRVSVEFESSGTEATAQLHDEGVSAPTYDSTVEDSSLSPNSTETTIEESPVTLKVDIFDPDFGTPQGDSVTLEWYLDGALQETTTVSSNGTASIDVEPNAGEHTWHVEVVEDSYGNPGPTSATASFAMPGELRVYEENATETLVDDVTVRLRFYGASNESFNVERSTSNGKIDMSGLPVDEEFIVVAEADGGYFNRRIYVSSLVDQQAVYLLPEGQESVYNVFTLTDRSGSYPVGETRLIIQRALNKSGQLRWTTIAGDFFGSTGSFPVYLSYNERFRLLVENNEGDQRVIGTYTATDEDNPKPIVIKSIIVDPPEDQNYYGTAWIEDEDENDGEKTLRFSYSDNQAQTTDLQLHIYERGNESNVIADLDDADPGDSWAYSYTLNGSRDELGKEWMVEWSATRNGNEIGGSFPIGKTGGLSLPMDGEWLTRFAFVALIIIAGMSSERIATLGAMGMVGFTGVMMVTGIWQVSIYLWFAGLVIALGGHALTMAQRGSIFG